MSLHKLPEAKLKRPTSEELIKSLKKHRVYLDEHGKKMVDKAIKFIENNGKEKKTLWDKVKDIKVKEWISK